MMIFICLVLAVCLARVQYLAAKFNMAARWNGYGAIPSIQTKSAQAPMAYRVLVPWLIGAPSIAKYEALQFALMFGALVSVYLAWGAIVLFITCILLTATFYYDYWDWAPELIGFSLALVSLPLAALGVVLHGLSRETAPLAGAVYALHSGDYMGGVMLAIIGALVLFLVRRVQGKQPLYCDRWMVKRNWKELRARKLTSFISIGLCALALAGAWGRWDGLIVPALIGAGWIMAVGAETRVFTSVLPYAALFLIRITGL